MSLAQGSGPTETFVQFTRSGLPLELAATLSTEEHLRLQEPLPLTSEANSSLSSLSSTVPSIPSMSPFKATVLLCSHLLCEWFPRELLSPESHRDLRMTFIQWWPKYWTRHGLWRCSGLPNAYPKDSKALSTWACHAFTHFRHFHFRIQI